MHSLKSHPSKLFFRYISDMVIRIKYIFNYHLVYPSTNSLFFTSFFSQSLCWYRKGTESINLTMSLDFFLLIKDFLPTRRRNISCNWKSVRNSVNFFYREKLLRKHWLIKFLYAQTSSLLMNSCIYIRYIEK